MNNKFPQFCKSVKCPYYDGGFLLYKNNNQFICLDKESSEEFLCGFITKAGNIRKTKASENNLGINLKQIKSFTTIYSYLKYIMGTKNESNRKIQRVSTD